MSPVPLPPHDPPAVGQALDDPATIDGPNDHNERVARLEQHGEIAPAVVVEVVNDKTATFEPTSGPLAGQRGSRSVCRCYSVGDRVEIRYDPADPTNFDVVGDPDKRENPRSAWLYWLTFAGPLGWTAVAVRNFRRNNAAAASANQPAPHSPVG